VASHVFLWSGPGGGQISIGFDDEHFGLPQMRAEIDLMRAAHPKLPDEVPRDELRVHQGGKHGLPFGPLQGRP
jgi:hypothetical protein